MTNTHPTGCRCLICEIAETICPPADGIDDGDGMPTSAPVMGGPSFGDFREDI